MKRPSADEKKLYSGNCLPLRGGYPGALFVAEVPFLRVGHSLSQSVDQSQWQRKSKGIREREWEWEDKGREASY